MLNSDQERTLHEQAYVPEHSVGLMAGISGASPFMFKDYLCLEDRTRLMVVGYPLKGPYDPERFSQDLDQLTGSHKASEISVIAPEPWRGAAALCVESEQDDYYIIEKPDMDHIRAGLLKKARKAAGELIIRTDRRFTRSHHELTREFLDRIQPDQRIIELYKRAPRFLEYSGESALISAWTMNGNLSAYYVADLAPLNFSSYIIGCHSRRNYVPAASDALMLELLEISRHMGKTRAHLGLGVNKGIRQFKKKWRGQRAIRFFRCEMVRGKTGVINAIRGFLQNR
jgi:hypothetical protein